MSDNLCPVCPSVRYFRNLSASSASASEALMQAHNILDGQSSKYLLQFLVSIGLNGIMSYFLQSLPPGCSVGAAAL